MVDQWRATRHHLDCERSTDKARVGWGEAAAGWVAAPNWRWLGGSSKLEMAGRRQVADNSRVSRRSR
jgi:hypothetical protein